MHKREPPISVRKLTRRPLSRVSELARRPLVGVRTGRRIGVHKLTRNPPGRLRNKRVNHLWWGSRCCLERMPTFWHKFYLTQIR